MWLRRLPEQTAASIVVAVHGPELEVFAFDGARDPLQSSVTVGDDPAHVELLLYDRPLDEYGLVEGRIAPAPPGAIRTRPLPEPSAIYVAQIDGTAAGEWGSAAMPSSELSAFRREGELVAAGCGPLHLERILVPESSGARFVVPLGDHALLGTTGDRVYRVDAEGQAPLEVSPPARLWRGASDDAHALWLFSLDGAESTLWRGTDGANVLSLEAVSTVTGTIAAVTVAAPDALIVVDVLGAILRFEAGTWTTLRGPSRATPSEESARLLTVGTGEVLILQKDPPELLRYRRGVLVDAMVPALLAEVSKPISLGRHPQLGVFVGLTGHDNVGEFRLLRQTEAGWEQWAVLGGEPWYVLPFGASMLVGYSPGSVVEIDPDTGPCVDRAEWVRSWGLGIGVALSEDRALLSPTWVDQGEQLPLTLVRPE